MSRTIILTGAPETSKLDWSEKTLISLTETVVTSLSSPETSPLSQNFTASWRQLPVDKLPMRPVLPKLEIDPPLSADGVDNTPATFFISTEYLSQDLGQESAGSDISAEDSRPSQDSIGTEDEALSDFYDHSFSIHEAIPTSQMTDSSLYTPGTPVYDSTDDMFSMTPATPGGIIKSPSERRLSQAPKAKRLTDVNDIPNASYLDHIHPQTMTVNLIVGILSISPSRKVITHTSYGRRQQVELVEMTVGDETKSGLSVSMWVPREMHVNWKDGAQEKPEGGRSNLRTDLKALRTRDVILLQNVALSSYRGKVHGQSLRGDVTKVYLLFRKKTEDDDRMGCYSVQNLRTATGKDQQIMKVKRVRDWLVENIGETPIKGRRRDRGPDYRGHRLLPNDTQ